MRSLFLDEDGSIIYEEHLCDTAAGISQLFLQVQHTLKD